ncbi:AAA family ATPase [Roseixanthobacter liquoris]|uniref:AAA family ATPase n=1 Tax=Roseixanthobacter liquoris TaxID=3119921 RepID=UPI00372C5A2E
MIHAFCESAAITRAVEQAAQDRVMGHARVAFQQGGLAGAIALYGGQTAPDLILIESRAPAAAILRDLDALSDVCDVGTRVVVIGHENDIFLYRELMRRGVSEYLLAPCDPLSLIHAISSIYRGTASKKLGKTIAFIGAKGGVGSSTLAHNVGWMIGRHTGSHVIMLDLDLPFGTGSLDFNLDAGMGVLEAIQDEGRLDDVLLDRLIVKCNDHLSLLRAPISLDRCYDPDPTAFAPLIAVAQESAPFLILDVPHLWSAWARNVVVAADEIIITAAPDLANLRNAKSMLDHLREARPNDAPPRVVLTQVGMPKRPEISPKEFAKALQHEPLLCIPFDARVFGTAANKGQMLPDVAAKSAAVRKIGELADVVAARRDIKVGARRTSRLSPLFERFRREPRG